MKPITKDFNNNQTNNLNNQNHKNTNNTPSNTIKNPNIAIIISVGLKNQVEHKKLQTSLDELELLLKTLGIATFSKLIQKKDKFSSSTLMGSGKLDEITQIANQVGAGLIVFDQNLTPSQSKNIEDITKCKVMDRTAVILEIFAKHAKTKYAKAQVEIAKLQYMLPRMKKAWTHLERQSASKVYARGMGEKQIEIDRRQIKDRIAKLQKNLEQFKQEKELQTQRRKNELRVAIVGYTNSGKTTLMNSLTKAQLLAKDELFATLDTNVKIIDPRTKPKILISDTVGFIQNLPHFLISSFKSTLLEALDADLLLHVIDISNPNYKEHIQVTERVLEEINASNIPIIKVFNKADLISDEPFLNKILKASYKNSVLISAYSQKDASMLRERIFKFFEENMIQVIVKIPHSDQQNISYIYQHAFIINADYTNTDYILFTIKITKARIAKISTHIVS